MALSIGSAGALPAIKQSSFMEKSLSKNCINVSKIQGLRFRIQVLLSLVFCILCFTAFAAAAQPEEQRTWTPVPLTSDAQIQSYVALCRAVYWENMGDHRETRRQLKAAIRLNPRSSFLYAKLAEILYALRFFRDAEAACKTSLKLNFNNADAHYLLGLLNYIQYDLNSRQASISESKRAAIDKLKRVAIDEFKAATDLNPEHIRAQHYLASILFDVEKDYRGAARSYSEIVKLKPYDHKLRNRLGISYSRSGATEKAIKEFDAAARLRKDYLDPHFHLAYLYAGQSRNKEAIEESLIVLERSPGDLSVNLLLAEIYVSMDEFDKAIPRAERVLRSGKKEKTMIAEAYYRLAAAYKGKKETSLADSYFQKSIDLYKEILQEDQEKIGIHYDIAMVYDAKGDLDLAERHLREYIKLDPDEANAHNFLGYAFLQNDVNLEEAVALIKKAVAMQPGNGAFRDSLGWAYFKQGNLDEAIVELEKAAELIPGDSEIREHLGEAYLGKGGKFAEKAVLEWEKALEIKPKNISLQEKLGKLRSSLGQTEDDKTSTRQQEEGTKEQ